MEIHRPHPRFRRHARELKDLPSENQTGSRRPVQRQGLRGGGEIAVCGAVHAQGGCAKGVEVDSRGECKE